MPHPTAQIFKRIRLSEIKSQDDSLSAFEVRLRNVSKSLLTCSVPDLQSDKKIIDMNILELEVYTYCSYITLFEDSLTVLGHEVGLTYTAVADYYDLCQTYFLWPRHYIFSILRRQ